MKKKLLQRIKQVFCRHEYEFIECDKIENYPGYFPTWYLLYRCEKCGKNEIIYVDHILSKLSDVNPKESIGYPKEALWLPSVIEEDLKGVKRESREVGYLVSKYYNKYGILLTAWGNREFGEKIDRNNLEIKSHDEVVIERIKQGKGLSPEDSLEYIMSRTEYGESMKQ